MVEKYYFRPDDETNFRDDENGPYVLYEDYRKNMSDALAYMQAMLNNERLAYERYRDRLTEDWQEAHEHRHTRLQDIINHLREGI